MFYEITTNLFPQTARTPYSIENRMNSAIRFSEGHHIVQDAAHFLRSNFDVNLFSGDHLLSIWRADDVAFTTKCLATFWWGNLAHNIATAYSPVNMNRLDAVSNRILYDFELVKSAPTFDTAMDCLRVCFRSFETKNEYKLERVDVSFFTKLFEFYFASHPLSSNPEFLPIICDVWLRKGVYMEMTENGDTDLRDAIFRNPTCLRSCNQSYVESYIAFCIYFNHKVLDIQTDFPNLNPFVLEGYVYSQTGRDYLVNRL